MESVFRTTPSHVYARAQSLLQALGVPLQGFSRSTFSRLKFWFHALYRTQQSNLYMLVSEYLDRIHSINPEMTVCLQKDTSNCFCRMFVAIPHASTIFQKLCLPAVHMDGTFFKTSLYDGVLILVVATSGNGSLLLLAAAWVPVEDTQNLRFVLDMLTQAGLMSPTSQFLLTGVSFSQLLRLCTGRKE